MKISPENPLRKFINARYCFLWLKIASCTSGIPKGKTFSYGFNKSYIRLAGRRKGVPCVNILLKRDKLIKQFVIPDNPRSIQHNYGDRNNNGRCKYFFCVT